VKAEAIAEKLGISRASVFRVLKDHDPSVGLSEIGSTQARRRSGPTPVPPDRNQSPTSPGTRWQVGFDAWRSRSLVGRTQQSCHPTERLRAIEPRSAAARI